MPVCVYTSPERCVLAIAQVEYVTGGGAVLVDKNTKMPIQVGCRVVGVTISYTAARGCESKKGLARSWVVGR